MMRGFTTDLRRIELLAGIDTRTHCILGEGSSAACRCGRTFETFEQGLLHVDEIGMYGENEDAFGQIEQPFARVYFLRDRICFDGKNVYPKDCILAVYGEHPGYEFWSWKNEPMRQA